ncbi:MAG: RNA methyltransferase [Sideroxydans sp.]|nr:RNA methyltransferase [Sideroxydans sp.]
MIPAAPPSLRITQLRQRLQDLGAKPCHEDRLLRGWSQVRSYDVKGSPAESFFPAAMRHALPAIEAELHGLASLQGEYPVDEEVARLLVKLHDGQMVESVLLPRGGLCISTQVGCAVGCVFCMSGRDGLIRQLGSAEIVAQVVLARKRRAVSKVVFMGMGEPAHNLDNVLEAIDVLGTLGGIGHKELVLSTVGDVRVFDRLMERCNSLPLPPPCRGRTEVGVETLRDAKISTPILTFPLQGGRNSSAVVHKTVRPALALSLHSTDATLRAKLLPHAPNIAVEELVERAEVYARATGYPTQYQWTLIEGVNDSDAEVARIAQLLKGKYALMNFIPFNAVDGLPYRRPSAERTAAMMYALNQQGIYSRVRDSAGQEVEGACGQLRARAVKAK